MQVAVRLADPTTQSRYPLPVQGTGTWQARRPNTWQLEASLEDLPAAHILVPSFACLNSDYEYHCELTTYCAEHMEQHRLQTIPKGPAAPADQAISHTSAHIDCWHSEQHIDKATLTVTVTTDQQPTEYLLAFSARPLVTSAPTLPNEDIVHTQPPSQSQMLAADDIKQRICSPTALAMLLADKQRLCLTHWQDTVDACYDPVTRAYGAWPLAIHWASKQGLLGAVEVLENADEIAKSLAGGSLICSIRFDENKLSGAPLQRSAGHLVVLYGVTEAHALVMDSAAASNAEVAIRYQRDEFTDAWLSHRGAAYVFCP